MKPILAVLFLAALLCKGCATTQTSQTGTIQLPPVEYVR
jgi:hypothetical protein